MTVPETPRPQPALWAHLPPDTRQRLLLLLSRWTLRQWTPPPASQGGHPHERDDQ